MLGEVLQGLQGQRASHWGWLIQAWKKQDKRKIVHLKSEGEFELFLMHNSFPLTCKSRQKFQESGWACQQTGSLSFPSVSPETRTTANASQKANEWYSEDAVNGQDANTSLTSRLPLMTAGWEPGGSIRRGPPTERFCPCCSWMDCGRMRCC